MANGVEAGELSGHLRFPGHRLFRRPLESA